MKTVSILIITVIALAGWKASAQQNTSMGEVREFFNGSRSLAMGGAGIAVVNDETALFTNPAGLGKLRDFYGTVFDPEIDVSGRYPEIYKKQAFGNPFNPSEVAKTLDSSRDTYFHARAQLFPSLVVRNFGIGIFTRESMDAYMEADGANMQTRYVSDQGLLLGYNLRLWDGRIKIGVTGKAIARIEIDKRMATSGSMDLASNASEGAGIGADVGLTLTAPWTWLPTVSAVVRDVGGTNFEAGSGLRMSAATRPNKLEQDIDVAVALFPIHSNSSRSSFTIEYQKLKAASQSQDKARYLHAGYEWNYSDLLFVRLGYNQKYPTGGIEVATERTQMQFTTYGEEVGPEGKSVEDRRFIFKFTFRF